MRIEDMSIDQLLELNQYVCRRIDELRDQENLQALSQLRVGLKVTFEGREGPVSYCQILCMAGQAAVLSD